MDFDQIAPIPLSDPFSPAQSIPDSKNSDDITYPIKRGMGAPFKFATPEDLQIAVDKYFADPESKPWRMSGLAYYLGVSRVCLLDYKNRTKYGQIVERAKDKIEASIEQLLLERGGPSPAGIIFNLHNNYSWRQKSEQDINVGGQENNPVKIQVNFTKPGTTNGSQD
jgi:hypothetical protein